jgi:DNA-3-methyladenine glycosylase
MRAGEIVEGEGVVVRRRGRRTDLVNGPGKLTQALGILGDHNGIDLLDPASPVRIEEGVAPGYVMATPRIGISRAQDLPWRFVETRPVGSGG